MTGLARAPSARITSSAFALIELLRNPTRRKLHAPGNFHVPAVVDQKMNVVTRGHEVDDAKTIAFARFEQPAAPATTIPCEFE